MASRLISDGNRNNHVLPPVNFNSGEGVVACQLQEQCNEFSKFNMKVILVFIVK